MSTEQLLGNLNDVVPGPALCDSVRSLVAIMERGGNSSALDDFMKNSNSISRDELLAVVGTAKYDEIIQTGLVYEYDGQVFLLIRCVMFNGGVYCFDSALASILRDKLGFNPAHYNSFYAKQIYLIDNVLSDMRARSYLEMGTGCGIIALEMGKKIPRVLGVDIYKRNLHFALLNKELCKADAVEFKESDLFSEVEGEYDCISFYPWEPTENSVALVQSFLLAVPGHLSDDGCVVLLTGTYSKHGDEVVDSVVVDCMRKAELSATKQVINTYFFENDDGVFLGYLNMFVIRKSKDIKDTFRIKNKVNINWFKRLVWSTLFPLRKLVHVFSCRRV